MHHLHFTNSRKKTRAATNSVRCLEFELFTMSEEDFSVNFYRIDPPSDERFERRLRKSQVNVERLARMFKVIIPHQVSENYIFLFLDFPLFHSLLAGGHAIASIAYLFT